MPKTECMKPIRVAVIAGGDSEEREISLNSGTGVARALENVGMDVEQLDLSASSTVRRLQEGDFDVAFLALHGGLGEDGSVQGLLQVLGIPYTGSGVHTSSTAMDKWESKHVYARAGLPVPPGVRLNTLDDTAIRTVVETIGFPCMLKPTDGGSSVGLTRINSENELRSFSETLEERWSDFLVERYVEGDVFTVGVLGNDELTTLPPLWLDFDGECDYEAKSGASNRLRHVVPAPNLTTVEVSELQSHARIAHEALGCRGVSRSDFIRDDDGQFLILETNTLPGMTETSSLPTAAAAIGISYVELCTMLVELAQQR